MSGNISLRCNGSDTDAGILRCKVELLGNEFLFWSAIKIIKKTLVTNLHDLNGLRFPVLGQFEDLLSRIRILVRSNTTSRENFADRVVAFISVEVKEIMPSGFVFQFLEPWYNSLFEH